MIPGIIILSRFAAHNPVSLMISINSAKNCMTCGRALKGRADKKFCDDYCRNTYNNHLKAGTNNYIRNINNALRKNRRILADLFPPDTEMTRASRERLNNLGFQFRYNTHTYTNKKGNTYHFCYDYGWLPLSHDWYLIVKRKKD